MRDSQVLRLGASGAVAATVLLIVLFATVMPAGTDSLALRGTVTPDDFATAVDRHGLNLRAAMAVDNLFVIGYTLALLGIVSLVRSRTPLLGNVALGGVLLGALLDYTENSITLALIQSHMLGTTPKPGWLLILHIVGQIKYLVAFLAVAALGAGLWSSKPLDRIVSILAWLFPIVGVVSFVVPGVSPLVVLWMFILLVSGGVLLWRRASDL
jgi:hypothetical protein